MLLNYNKKQFFLIAILFFLGMPYLSFGQFNSADLHSQVDRVQPMTGIVFWSANSGALSSLGNKVQLEYSYLVYSDVIQNQGAYNWSIVDNLLANAASNGRQMIIRFRYTYPGVTTPSVPNYVRNSFGYQDQILSVEGSSTYIPDWSSQALQDFTKEFYTQFAARYDNDSRLAFLQMGFGSYSEYHLYDGPLTLGQTFPSKSYQAEFLYHVNGLFQQTQWGISIDAAQSSRTPISSNNLQSLNYGLFDDSFLHETHSANDSEYNRASWLFFGANKYQTNAAGGELNYYSPYDQQTALNPNGPWGTSFETLSAQYNISYMLGNDQFNYQPASRIESAGMATGYRFLVEGYVTNGSTTRATIRNTGIAPIYYDAYPSIGGIRSNSSLKGLLPNQAQEFTISRGAIGEDLTIECDRLSPSQVIQFDANIDGGINCPSVGQACDDQNACTTGTTYDISCNCTGGTYTCGGNKCITIDQSLNDWSTIAPLSSNAGFILKAADDNNTLYISVSGTIGDFGEGYQIFLDTDNSGSEFTYYSAWFQTGFDAMIENGSFSSYTGTGSDWSWSAETSIISSKTTSGLELKIDKSLLNASSSNIRIGFVSLSNWGGAAFVPPGNNASYYTLSSSLNCDDTCPDADGDGVCDADDICPGGDDNIDTDGDGIPDACDNCNTGQSCNDFDDCTTGTTYDANCNCTGGTFQDADGDGVCDANDICPGGDDNIDTDGDGTPDACDNCNQQGQACNDFDDCTTGETYDANCNCTGGTSQDADQDGVCAALDPDDNDPCVPNACNGGACELLTNTNFDNNLQPDWDYWGCTATAANGVATLTNIANGQEPWLAGFYMDNILVEQGESYVVRFRARADANRTIKVKVGQNGFPYTDYLYQTANLTTNMQNFTMSFTMNEPTDYNTAFDFFIAGNTANVYIDNVSLQKVDCAPACPQELTNTNFDSNLNTWSHWGCNATPGNGMANITNIVSSPDYWNVGFVQSNVLIEQGETYEVTFQARANGNRPLEVRIGLDVAPYTDYHYQAVNLNSNMQVYNMSFTMNSPTDNNSSFGFYMGGGNTANTYIDNVSLKKADCGGTKQEVSTSLSATLYPNPAKNILNIDFENTINEEGTAYIFTPSGQLVSQQNIPSGTQNMNIPVDRLPAGIYFIRVQFGSDIYTTQRFVKLSN